MSKKGENIYRRQDGRWEARYVRGRKMDGSILYGYCYAQTYGEAKAQMELAQAGLITGNEPVHNHLRMCTICVNWEHSLAGRVKNASLVKYDTILRLHVVPAVGGLYPQDITCSVAEEFQYRLLCSGLATKTVRDIMVVLLEVMKYASKQIPGVHVPAVELPKVNTQEARVLTVDEHHQLMDIMERSHETWCFGTLFALHTGLRLGEICALKWSSVNLSACQVSITESLSRVANLAGEGPRTLISITTPKTENAVRSIPLTGKTVALCKRFDPHNPEAYLLTGTVRFMEPRTLQRKLEQLTQANGIPGVHFHTLRHSFATRCVESGFEMKSLSEVMGHASANITINRYVHSSMELKRKNMEKLAEAGF